MRRFCLCLLILCSCASASVRAQSSDAVSHHSSAGDSLVAEYFTRETERLSQRTFADIETLEDWEQKRGEYRRQLLEMLGLDPLPAKTPLDAVVTRTLEKEGVIVENLHFQSRPGLYVTANLYRPRDHDGPLPAILYVCGHGAVRKDGISLGNKTHYQHHGGWFARNGYICLTLDTIQLGEIEGIHHGTYREKMWWWNNRGYTPAGVEAWNCVRALDYLETRDEVDRERIGVTGRSGGGAYSWWVAAIDDRIKAAVPVAGITSLKNHVVDGTVEGHCDCMFMVNTYGWDYPMIAALVAPRPLLISNTDKDRIFPLDGVVDVYMKTRKIYQLYGATDRFGLHITEGPHKDTQELRVHAFRWLNRFLKQDDRLITTAATPLFDREELKVFDELPDDQRVTTIHESFVAQAASPATPQVIGVLRERTFGGWPANPEPFDLTQVTDTRAGDWRVRRVEFNSQLPYRLPFILVDKQGAPDRTDARTLVVIDQSRWDAAAAVFRAGEPLKVETVESMRQDLGLLAGSSFAIFAPRGVGETEWSRDDRKRTQIRRRFMQIGQTAAAMQIYDVVRAVQAIRQTDDRPLVVNVEGDAAFWALYAALFVDGIDSMTLRGLPESNRQAPDLLNVSRFVTLDDVVRLAAQRVKLRSPPSE